MDTRFWGPDGWKLLHMVAQNYPEHPTKIEQNTYKIFFESLQHVLPCIYCRMSYTEYINDIPINKFIDSKKNMTKWLYLIHNKVNDKLRKQGLLHYKDPTFDEVYDKYEKYLKEINSDETVNIPGWDFLYSIIFNYPAHSSQIELVRRYHYIIFFKYLGLVLPFKFVDDLYKEFLIKKPIQKNMVSRIELKQWGYNLEKFIHNNSKRPCISYIQRCKNIEKHRAGCKRKTCRYTTKK